MIESLGVSLRGAQPVLNGLSLEGWACEVLHLDSGQIDLRYTSASLGGGAFRLQATQPDRQHHIWMRYWLEGLPHDLVLDSFGLRFEQVENLRQYLLNGYFSGDGSYYVQPDTMADFQEDSTHPDDFNYLRNVFRAWRHEWGCEYFKTDFMHFGSEYGPDRAIWHTPGMTRIEIWRHATEMTLAIYAGMTGGVMMTSEHLGEHSPVHLKLRRFIWSEERASGDFPLLGRSDIFYERPLVIPYLTKYVICLEQRT